jgi:hypothetical protein
MVPFANKLHILQETQPMSWMDVMPMPQAVWVLNSLHWRWRRWISSIVLVKSGRTAWISVTFAADSSFDISCRWSETSLHLHKTHLLSSRPVLSNQINQLMSSWFACKEGSFFLWETFVIVCPRPVLLNTLIKYLWKGLKRHLAGHCSICSSHKLPSTCSVPVFGLRFGMILCWTSIILSRSLVQSVECSRMSFHNTIQHYGILQSTLFRSFNIL